ncbi:MAG: hypothetical protein K1W08_14260 [Lachnospiraceae bacterium]
MSGQGALARRALEACRNQLFFENRFLEQALFRLKWEEGGAVYFGSDGGCLYYSADYILKRYMQEPKQLMMDYLHTVMHCLYQHPFFVPQEQREYWDVAADIAVECILEEMSAEDIPLFDTPQGQARRNTIKRIQDKINAMSAQKIFVFLLRNMPSDKDFLAFFGMSFAELCALFRRDEHRLWYADESTEESSTQQGGMQSKENSTEQGEMQSKESSAEKDDIQSKGHRIRTDDRRIGRSQKQIQQVWKGVAEQMLMDLQSFSRHTRGDLSGNMVKTLQKLTRENFDYSTFLLKFAARLEERMQTDMDEFDYVFYTYGLRLDKRMPLIEPLEYKDKYLLREFVIAIDTSGSCEGELVEKFLTKTYNILRQTESFTSKVNIHLIQCDAVIQEDVTIQSQQDLEEYIAHFTLKGFGGTDFRPVFEHIERMMESGAIQRLEGLLYFTDGYGIFPAKPPKYKTAFVFLDQEENVKVPAWAMKVYIEEETL